MGIRPTFKSLLRNKTGPVLVALQIAVTLAIVVNALFIVQQRIEKMNRDTGMDVANVIAVYVRGFGTNLDVTASVDRDLDLLRSIPGVVAATISNHVPLSGSGSGTGLRTVPDETVESVRSARYRFDEHGLDALGIKLARGRNFLPVEVQDGLPTSNLPAPASVLVTQDLANDLFGDEDALGKTVYWSSLEPSTIVGIIDHMHGSWVNWDKLSNVVIQPGRPMYETNKYLLRTEPGQRDRLIPEIEKQLGEIDRQRVVKSVESLEELAADSYRRDRGMAIILGIVVVLLVGLLMLVIAGLSSFHVTQRRRQIGTRRALGATRGHIMREFALENWIIACAGSVLGALLTVATAWWLETSFSLPRLDWLYLPAAIAALWVISLVAVLAPARRAASLPPSIATRNV